MNIGKIKKTKKTNCLEIKKTINEILNKSQCTLFKDRYNIYLTSQRGGKGLYKSSFRAIWYLKRQIRKNNKLKYEGRNHQIKLSR